MLHKRKKQSDAQIEQLVPSKTKLNSKYSSEDHWQRTTSDQFYEFTFMSHKHFPPNLKKT